MKRLEECVELSARIRKTMLKFDDSKFGTHWGGSLSEVEILAVLYNNVMNCKTKNLDYAKKDKFILSKGHGSIGLYAALIEVGLLSESEIPSFQNNGSHLSELVIYDDLLQTEHSGGSLGLGLSMGVGMALSAKLKNYTYSTYVVVGDGELNEGAIWEAVMSAPRFKLDNLFLIIDNNGLQYEDKFTDIVSINIFDALTSFGWEVKEANGHNCGEILDAFNSYQNSQKPKALIAKTIKGKGISFIENAPIWHHYALNKEQLDIAKKEMDIHD